jgi:hypothetical protein
LLANKTSAKAIIQLVDDYASSDVYTSTFGIHISDSQNNCLTQMCGEETYMNTHLLNEEPGRALGENALMSRQ